MKIARAPDGGIIVDERRCKSSVAGVHAAGDACSIAVTSTLVQVGMRSMPRCCIDRFFCLTLLVVSDAAVGSSAHARHFRRVLCGAGTVRRTAVQLRTVHTHDIVFRLQSDPARFVRPRSSTRSGTVRSKLGLGLTRRDWEMTIRT